MNALKRVSDETFPAFERDLFEMRLDAFFNENASQMKPLLRPDAFDIKSENFEKYMTIHLRFELSRHH